MSDQRDAELLTMVGLKLEDIPRFRGVYVEGERVRVETRVGGGNTEDYLEEITALRARPNYLDDEEDWGDRTYRYFYFGPAGMSKGGQG